MMPLFCWSKKVGPPKLRITKLTSIFAQCVGEMNIILNNRSLDSSDDDSSSDDESEVEPSDPEKKQTDRVEGTTDVYLPDPEKFPLLHSIGYNPMIMDRLLQEILLFHGNNRISFTRRNNRKGTLVILPSHRKLDHFEAELSKNQSALDNIIDTVTKNAQSSKEEAAECLLNSMYRKYEDTFVSVAIAKCVVNEKSQEEEKMDVISTEAMI